MKVYFDVETTEGPSNATSPLTIMRTVEVMRLKSHPLKRWLYRTRWMVMVKEWHGEELQFAHYTLGLTKRTALAKSKDGKYEFGLDRIG